MGAWKDAMHTDIQGLLREPRELALLTRMTPSPHLSTPAQRRVQRKSEQQHQARPARKSSWCRAREAPSWHFKCKSPWEAAPAGVSLGSETKGRNSVPAHKLAPGPLCPCNLIPPGRAFTIPVPSSAMTAPISCPISSLEACSLQV